VILELEPQYQQDFNALLSLYITSTSGQVVPLKTFALVD
jgi:HAE1 family hydrophobic/amphiphilic exporter-1